MHATMPMQPSPHAPTEAVQALRNTLLRAVRALGLAFTDPLYYAALGLSAIAFLLTPPATAIPPLTLAWLAFLEELVFRFGLQESLARFLARRELNPTFLGVTPANLLASALFALAHLVHHPGLLPLMTFFPGLVFGWAWTRYRSVLPCACLHFVYNLVLFEQARLLGLLGG